MGRLYAGTSGFAYPSWKPDFYPTKLPQKDFLKHYATRLNAVEINYTFRQLPSAASTKRDKSRAGPCLIVSASGRRKLFSGTILTKSSGMGSPCRGRRAADRG